MKTIKSFIQYRPDHNVSKSSSFESRARERSRTSNNGCSGKQQWHGITVINTGIFIKRGCVNERRDKKKFNAKTAFRENVRRMHLAATIRECISFSYFLVRYWAVRCVGEYDRIKETFNMFTYVKLKQFKKKKKSFHTFQKRYFPLQFKMFSCLIDFLEIIIM